MSENMGVDGVDRSAPGPPPTRIHRVEIAGRTIWQVIGAILVTLLLLRMADAASTLLGMVAIAFFFSLAMDPAVSALHRRRGWRRGSAVGMIYLTGAVLVGLMIFVLVPAIGTLADTVSGSADDWLASLNQWTSDTLGFPVTTDAVAQDAASAGQFLQRFGNEALGTALGIASAGVGFVFNLATIAMFAFYFTADAPRVKRAVLRLFSPPTQERVGWTWDQAIVQTGGYFYSRLLLMGINGTGFFVTMVVVGVPLSLALPLAVFAGFVSEFIPAIGTYIGAAVPIVLTLALQGMVPALVVLGYALVYQQIENYWLSPKISADTMSLNGGVAFGAALAGGAIAGPVGAFVALPVAALISSVFSNYGRSYEVVYHSQWDEAAEEPATADDAAHLPSPVSEASRETAPHRRTAFPQTPDGG